MLKMLSITTGKEKGESQRQEGFYFLLYLITSQHCKLTSVFPVVHYFQSSILVGLKFQGVSGLVYLCIFCHITLGFCSSGKASTKHLAKALNIITNKTVTCSKDKVSTELQPFTPVAHLAHPKP